MSSIYPKSHARDGGPITTEDGFFEVSEYNPGNMALGNESQLFPPIRHSMYATHLGQAHSSQRMQPRLVITAGSKRGAILWLDQDEVTIGRDAINVLCLDDDAVSRKQCAIKAEDGSYVVIDFNSRNGSFVNGVAIREKVLQHGDKIRIGCTELVFLENGDPAPVLPANQDDKALELTQRIAYPAEKKIVLNAEVPDKIAPRPLVRPVPVPMAPVPMDPSPLDGGATLAQFKKVLIRHRGKLSAFVGFAMLVAIAVQFLAPKVYEASALVKVERHSVAGVVGPEASQVSSVDDMDQIMATQLELAQSDPVLRPVAERYHLAETKPSRFVKSKTGKQNGEAPIMLQGLKVTRVPSSYLVRVAYRSHDPKRAADVANAIAQSMVEHANDTGRNSYARISALVEQDMSALRAKVEASEQRLAEYEKELNLDPEQRATMVSARLAQINTEFTAAQAERIHRQAIMAQVEGSTSLASAQAAQAASQDTLLSEAVQRLNLARQQFTSIRSFYGEGHPEYAKAEKQLKEVQAQVDELKARAQERASAEYRQALGREYRLLAVLQQTKQEGDSLKPRLHQYEQLKSEAENDRKIYQDLATRTRLEGINQEFQNATVQLVTRALVPQNQLFPKLLINLPLALILSGILGILVAVIGNAVSNTFSDAEEVASQLHVDVLAAIPATMSLPSIKIGAAAALATSKRSAALVARYAEAIRSLRTALNLVMSNASMRTLLVTSAVPGEGKSTTAAQLALAYAQMGRKVLLIDANFRRPNLDKMFNVASPIGFSDVLTRRRSYTDVLIKLEQPGLFLMPAGPVSRTAVDVLSKAASILKKISREFDLVIVDAPPVLAASEAQELAGAVDGVLLITKADATTGELVSKTLSALHRARANVIGLVLNQIKSSDAVASPSYYRLEASEAMPRLTA